MVFWIYERVLDNFVYICKSFELLMLLLLSDVVTFEVICMHAFLILIHS